MQWGIRVALATAAFFWVTAARAGDLRGGISPFGSFVASADLDGDSRPDVASAGPSRRDAAGYALDITIRLSSLQTGAVTVRTSRAADRLFLRDLDGDSDGDLIVESFDREPLAIVLNDGGGHFHQGNLDDYRAKLRRPESRSVEAPAVQSDPPETFETLDAPAAAPPPSVSDPLLDTANAPRLRNQCVSILRHTVFASRGPPSSC